MSTVTLTVNLSGMSEDRARNPGDEMLYGKQAYGRYMASTGAARLFDVLDELGVRTTTFVPAAEAEALPHLIARIAEAGHEIAAHGIAHEDYGDVGERARLEEGRDRLAAVTGQAPRGWRAPTGVLGPETLGHLAALGYAYDSSNQDDDFPYSLGPEGGGEMVELPQTEMLGDRLLYENRATHSKLLAWWQQEIDALLAESGYPVLTVSPRADHGSGRPSRVSALRSFIEGLLARPNLSFATCAEVADAVAAGRFGDRAA